MSIHNLTGKNFGTISTLMHKRITYICYMIGYSLNKLIHAMNMKRRCKTVAVVAQEFKIIRVIVLIRS